MQAYVQIGLDATREKDILDKLGKMKEVKEVYILFGEWDMIAKIEVKSAEELGSFIMDHIRSMPGIKLTSTMIIAK